jgi:uracil-DNA glycosylase family protein
MTAAEYLPSKLTLPALHTASLKCKGCDLYKYATQTVFGNGKKSASIIFIGEQPGDREDIAGIPFVGPAGLLLDKALETAKINKKEIYITNAVKHFKFEQRGKRRLHKKPNLTQINACKPWLEAEIAAVKPQLIVCLGATAAQSLLGASFRIMKERGKFKELIGKPPILVTIHPSALLRLPSGSDREKEFQKFVNDLKQAVPYA